MKNSFEFVSVSKVSMKTTLLCSIFAVVLSGVALSKYMKYVNSGGEPIESYHVVDVRSVSTEYFLNYAEGRYIPKISKNSVVRRSPEKFQLVSPEWGTVDLDNFYQAQSLKDKGKSVSILTYEVYYTPADDRTASKFRARMEELLGNPKLTVLIDDSWSVKLQEGDFSDIKLDKDYKK